MGPLVLAVALAATAPVDVTILGRHAKAWASSQLTSKDANRYAVKNAFDGDRQTAWVEGVPGVGAGESLFLEFPQPMGFDGFLLVPGYARTAATLLQNSAPTAVELYADGSRVLAVAVLWAMKFTDQSPRCLLTDNPLNFAPRIVVFAKPLKAKKLELRIAAAEKGTRFEDTAITEWWPIFEGVAAAIGEDSFQDPRTALISLRPAKTPALGRNVSADPLLPWPPDPAHAHPDYQAFMEKRLAGAPPRSPQGWLKALTPELLDQLVTVTGDHPVRLIGAMAWTEGAGEWTELYPSLLLDMYGNITRLQNLFRSDGAPGCHGALPEKLPSP